MQLTLMIVAECRLLIQKQCGRQRHRYTIIRNVMCLVGLATDLQLFVQAILRLLA
jgi:hypothetical protein